MCLEANVKIKRNFKRRNKNYPSLICYKIYRVCHDKMYSHGMPDWDYPIQPGRIVSDRTGNSVIGSDVTDFYYNKNTIDIYLGIHVYLNLKHCIERYNTYLYVKNKGIKNPYDIVIVPVYCELKNLIAIDKEENYAVFTEVFLDKENYQRALEIE